MTAEDRAAAEDITSDAALERWVMTGNVETLTEWRERVQAKPVPPENRWVR